MHQTVHYSDEWHVALVALHPYPKGASTGCQISICSKPSFSFRNPLALSNQSWLASRWPGSTLPSRSFTTWWHYCRLHLRDRTKGVANGGKDEPFSHENAVPQPSALLSFTNETIFSKNFAAHFFPRDVTRFTVGAVDTWLCGQFSRGFGTCVLCICYSFFLHMIWKLCTDLTGKYFPLFWQMTWK